MARNKMDVKRYAEAGVSDGYGGWHCPCCNPYGTTTRKMKKKAHRTVRRKEKIQSLSVFYLQEKKVG